MNALGKYSRRVRQNATVRDQKSLIKTVKYNVRRSNNNDDNSGIENHEGPRIHSKL